LLVGFLKVGNWIWLARTSIIVLFGLKCPEMEDESGPQSKMVLSVCDPVGITAFLRSMSLFSLCPGPYAVVRADEIITDKYGIVTIGDTSNHLAVVEGPPVSTLMMRA